MLSNTSIWNSQIFKKFEKFKVWKFSYLKKSAITFAQGCTILRAYTIHLTQSISIVENNGIAITTGELRMVFLLAVFIDVDSIIIAEKSVDSYYLSKWLLKYCKTCKH